MNIELMEKVRDTIARTDPKHFDMTSWVDQIGDKWLEDDGTHIAECGTSMCIAGWAIHLDNDEPLIRYMHSMSKLSHGLIHENVMAIRDRAADLLDINSIDAGALFHIDEWPDDYRFRYEEAEWDSVDAGETPVDVTVDLLDEIISAGAIWWTEGA